MTAPLNALQRVRLDTLVVQLQERRMHTKAGDLRQALDLLDAQAAVIQRWRNSWRPAWPNDDRKPLYAHVGTWWKPGWPDPQVEPMTDAEQAVLKTTTPSPSRQATRDGVTTNSEVTQ